MLPRANTGVHSFGVLRIVVSVVVVVILAAVDITKADATPVLRVKRLTLDRFEELMASGVPVVVEDVQDNMTIKDWSCESLRRDFPDEPIEVFTTYSHQNVRSTMGGDWEGELERKFAAEAPPEEQAGAIRPSFWWHPIYDGFPNPGRTNLDREGVTKLSESWSVPYFLPNDSLNRQAAKDRIELFAGPPTGTGTKLHIDTICQSIYSMQLSGYKRWFLSPAPARVADRFEDPNEVVSSRPLSHMYETLLGPGDTLFFPVGFVHGTKTEYPPANAPIGSSNCSLSASFQYFSPHPAKYMRDNIAILTHAGKIGETCFHNEWGPAITGVRPLRTHQGGHWGQARANAAELDTDGDGFITRAEFTNVFAMYDAIHLGYCFAGIEATYDDDIDDAENERNKERRKRMRQRASLRREASYKLQEFAGHDVVEDRSANAANTFVRYHDIDGDGLVSSTEYEKGFVEFQSELLDAYAGFSSKQQKIWRDRLYSDKAVSTGKLYAHMRGSDVKYLTSKFKQRTVPLRAFRPNTVPHHGMSKKQKPQQKRSSSPKPKKQKKQKAQKARTRRVEEL